jgi:hypothetical protein
MENISYAAVDKRLHVVKMVSKKNQSKRKLEDEIEERNRPNPFTYSPDDRKIKNKLPMYTMPRGRRGDRTPSPDRRKALIVSDRLTKKNPRKVAILPEHNMTEKQLLKEYEETRLGPATYNPEFKHVEPRVDIGIVKIRSPYRSPREQE